MEGTYVAGPVHCSAHDDDLLDLQEGLGVRGCGDGEVGERSDGDDGDGVWFVFSKQPQHLLVGGLDRRREERMCLSNVLQLLCFLWAEWLGNRLEEGLPCFRRRHVGMLRCMN